MTDSATGDGRTLDSVALAYVTAVARRAKLDDPPATVKAESPAPVHACPAQLRPGRSARLTIGRRAAKTPKPGALREVSARAKLLHLFLHHEVQAAELSAWAILRFRDSPIEFRRGLYRVMRDEVRHASMYAARLADLGFEYGSFAIRDWFWEKVPVVETAMQYTALMGLGFEAGNLEHAERFEGQLSAAGDPESAALVARVGVEEIAHVRFAARWFQYFNGADELESPDFDLWSAALPNPLTPAVLRGKPLQWARRRQAGLSQEFLERLDKQTTEQPTTEPSPRSVARKASRPGPA